MLENIPIKYQGPVSAQPGSHGVYLVLRMAIATSTSHKLESPGKRLSEGASTLGRPTDYYS